jgi:hypothetical protein
LPSPPQRTQPRAHLTRPRARQGRKDQHIRTAAIRDLPTDALLRIDREHYHEVVHTEYAPILDAALGS